MDSNRRSLTSANPNSEASKPNGSLDRAAKMAQNSCFSTTKASGSVRSVFLCVWWLEKTNDKRLAVGGLASRERLSSRIFISAPVSKRNCVNELETEDGVTITISGLIDRSRTLENGISSEVCNQFLVGFPYNWEDYATLNEESSVGASLTKISGRSEDKLPFTISDLPRARTRNLLLSSIHGLDFNLLSEGILNEIGGPLRRTAKKRGRPFKSTASKEAGVSIRSNRECSLNMTDRRSGVLTRSMTKRNNPRLP